MITAAIKVFSECFITTKQQSVNNIFYYKQLQLHGFQQKLLHRTTAETRRESFFVIFLKNKPNREGTKFVTMLAYCKVFGFIFWGVT